jgi:REP element-mobilizing transposase RayT
MPKARYLAPWSQADLLEALGGRPVGQELDEEALRVLRGKPAIYHCISRVVDRRFVFGVREKEKFVALMRLYERFCQVRVLGFCVMSNHFHILLEVPAAPEGRGRDWSDARLLDHLSILYPEEKLAEIRWWLEHYRSQKNDAAAEQLRESYFRRMWDLSEFMKPLKQCFTRWFNTEHERRGTLWEERFKSVLVEDGQAARVMAAYIDLNPVRAGMVEDPKDYRWCSYGEAVGGNERSREGIQRVMFESAAAWASEEMALGVLTNWREAVKGYREVLYAYSRRGAVHPADAEMDPSMAEALGGRVRQFIDGMAFGRQSFVDAVFRLTRDSFGPNRRDGARKLRGVATELRAMRDLQSA